MPLPVLLFAAAILGPCEPAQAVRASIDEIRARPEAYIDRCVRVAGFSNGVSMFKSRTEPHRMRNGIGIYDLPRLPAGPADDGGLPVHRWSVVGRVDSCERIRDRMLRALERQRRSDPDILPVVFMTGHCHYVRGPVIFVDAARRLD